MADEAELSNAIRAAIAANPEGAEAGPKALLTAVQEADAKFASVGIQKFKKALTKVKAALKEEEEAARIEAAKPRVGTKDDCPGRHGLSRFLTNHGSYCCDTCRCYVPIGSPMWGCRQCDWDVCEGRCRPAEAMASLEDFDDSMSALEERVSVLRKEAPADFKPRLAQAESEVHKLEKKLDCSTAKGLAEVSKLAIGEEEARESKKKLLGRTERLLTEIEGLFATMSIGGGASA